MQKEFHIYYMDKNLNKISLTKNKIYLQKECLKNKEFINKLSNGIFAMFSFLIDTPKVLILRNSKKKSDLLDFNLLTATLNYKLVVDVFMENNRHLFNKAVHNFEYDLGLILGKTNGFFTIEFVSGSGQNLSDTKMSIIKKYLNVL